MAPIKSGSAVLAAIKEIQEECFKLGIPLKTRHREVAPNQYEIAPEFGDARVKVDQNLLLMQIVDEVCTKHGLAALMVEKPFAGVNGSGKHNNWSIATDTGVNLYNPKQLTEAYGDPTIFAIVMAATVAAIDKYGDMMRMAIASPGNDFRLGCMEAPPAVISTYLGEQMTQFLKAFMENGTTHYAPKTTPIDFGCSSLPGVVAPAEDRNRTSPFAYGGHRFEFRAVGSSQNVSLVNVVLATMVASEFADISSKIEAGRSAVDVAKAKLKAHMKVVFNGNGYDSSWPSRAEKIGIYHIPSGIEAIKKLSDRKNKELFSSMGVFTAEEVDARKDILLEHYVGVIEMEVLTMADMISQHVVPAAKAAGLEVDAVMAGADTILSKLKEVHNAKNIAESATLARTLRLETMEQVRKLCDEIEGKVPADKWTLATYKDLLFLDSHRSPAQAEP
jgi:glutamine synthetase